jgi:hypothetical protein
MRRRFDARTLRFQAFSPDVLVVRVCRAVDPGQFELVGLDLQQTRRVLLVRVPVAPRPGFFAGQSGVSGELPDQGNQVDSG